MEGDTTRQNPKSPRPPSSLGTPFEPKQDHPDDASAERAKCLEAFVLLWSKEPQVFAAVEEHLREHPLPEGLGAVEGMEVG